MEEDGKMVDKLGIQPMLARSRKYGKRVKGKDFSVMQITFWMEFFFKDFIYSFVRERKRQYK